MLQKLTFSSHDNEDFTPFHPEQWSQFGKRFRHKCDRLSSMIVFLHGITLSTLAANFEDYSLMTFANNLVPDEAPHLSS